MKMKKARIVLITSISIAVVSLACMSGKYKTGKEGALSCDLPEEAQFVSKDSLLPTNMIAWLDGDTIRLGFDNRHPFVRCVLSLGGVTDANCEVCSGLLAEGEMPEYTDLGFYVVQQ
jgi:hypothetical protein